MSTLGEFIGVLLIVGFVGAYFRGIAVAAVGVGLVYYGPRVWRAYCARVARSRPHTRRRLRRSRSGPISSTPG